MYKRIIQTQLTFNQSACLSDYMSVSVYLFVCVCVSANCALKSSGAVCRWEESSRRRGRSSSSNRRIIINRWGGGGDGWRFTVPYGLISRASVYWPVFLKLSASAAADAGRWWCLDRSSSEAFPSSSSSLASSRVVCCRLSSRRKNCHIRRRWLDSRYISQTGCQFADSATVILRWIYPYFDESVRRAWLKDCVTESMKDWITFYLIGFNLMTSFNWIRYDYVI